MFEGQSDRHPISLIIRTHDQRSKDYGDIRGKVPPSVTPISPTGRNTAIATIAAADESSAPRGGAWSRGGRFARAALAKMVPACAYRLHGADGAHGIDRARFDEGEIEAATPSGCPTRRPQPNGPGIWMPAQIRRQRRRVNRRSLALKGVPAGLVRDSTASSTIPTLPAAMMSSSGEGRRDGQMACGCALTAAQCRRESPMGPDGSGHNSNHAGGILGGNLDRAGRCRRLAVSRPVDLDAHAARSPSGERDRNRDQRAARPLCRYPCRAGGEEMMACVCSITCCSTADRSAAPAWNRLKSC